MEINRQKAWDILTTVEQQAISIQFGHDKSSWQVGEMLGKSHYKYLEIKYRAEFFLKRFAGHFKLFDDSIPDYIVGDKKVIEYFRNCLDKRVKPMAALEIINDKKSIGINKSALNERIIKQMHLWGKSENLYETAIFNLIKDFDRWNNFRVLPKDIQEPSAYKRRQKNVHKRRMKLTFALPDISVELIETIFKAKRNQPFLYLPIIHKKAVKMLRIKKSPETIEYIASINLYLFDDIEHATEYMQLIDKYINKKDKECQDGLNFWPKYRELVKHAINYEAIDNITPTRKYLKLALEKLTFN